MPDKTQADNSSALLAELDQLLEKMMALPVSPSEEPEADRQPEPPSESPLATVAEALPPLTPAMDDLYVRALLQSQEEAPSTPLAEPASFWNEPPSLEPALPAPSEPVVRPAVAEEPPLALWAYPLAGLNAAFDVATVPLGFAGRLLRGPLGRSLLGWAGVAMLLAVLGLAAHDGLQWTR